MNNMNISYVAVPVMTMINPTTPGGTQPQQLTVTSQPMNPSGQGECLFPVLHTYPSNTYTLPATSPTLPILSNGGDGQQRFSYVTTSHAMATSHPHLHTQMHHPSPGTQFQHQPQQLNHAFAPTHQQLHQQPIVTFIPTVSTATTATVGGGSTTTGGTLGPHSLKDGSFSLSMSTSSMSLSQQQQQQQPQQQQQQQGKYKTLLCRSFMSGRSCKYGDRCLFAHGEVELRPLSGNPTA